MNWKINVKVDDICKINVYIYKCKFNIMICIYKFVLCMCVKFDWNLYKINIFKLKYEFIWKKIFLYFILLNIFICVFKKNENFNWFILNICYLVIIVFFFYVDNRWF